MDHTTDLDAALQSYAAGDYAEAIRACRTLVEQAAAEADSQAKAAAQHVWGLAAFHSGDSATASAVLRSALSTSPSDPALWNSLGVICQAAGDLDAARHALSRAVELAPHESGSHFNLGVLFRDMGQYGAALAALRKARDLAPQDAECACELAGCLLALQRPTEAAAGFRDALQLAPQSARAWFGLGCAHTACGDHLTAIDCYQRVLQAHPEHDEARHNLGRALFEIGEPDAAFEQFRQVTSPHCRAQAQAAMATLVPGCSSADHRTIREVRSAWAQQYCDRPAAPARSFARDRRQRPLRVGYVSAFFGTANWMKPVWGLINQHGRTQFEIHLFHDGAPPQPQTGYEPQPVDRIHDITALNNEQAADYIASQQIDVLVDLNGYSVAARLALFGFRPAPVQITWFNMYATSGLRAFDYIVGDPVVVRPEEDSEYVERIIRVPACYLTFAVNYAVPDVAPPPCQTSGTITFGNFATQYKLTAAVLDCWAEILRRAPATQLFLKNRALGQVRLREHVLEQFATRGIDVRRITLAGPDPHMQFLDAYRHVDIALDTFPYNGGTTTTEALWQGVPVLAFEGDHWIARQSASLLKFAHLDQFLASSVPDLIDRAVNLATSPDTPDLLARLRRDMRDKLRASPVCDVAAFCRQMERAWLTAWDEWCS